MTNKEFLERYDAKNKFSEDELKMMVWGEYPTESELIEENAGDEGRWYRYMNTIFKVDGRYFSLSWSRGLTECQENEYMYQPVEVKLHEYEKTITVREWEEI